MTATGEEQAVAKAKSNLDAAQKVLADVQAKHDAAVAAHAAALKALEPVPVFGKHILVDHGATGNFSLEDAPSVMENGREVGHLQHRHLIRGTNVEHVGEDPVTGVWQYRKM